MANPLAFQGYPDAPACSVPRKEAVGRRWRFAPPRPTASFRGAGRLHKRAEQGVKKNLRNDPGGQKGRSLWVRPRKRARILLHAVLLIGERVLQHLARTHAGDAELPARCAAIKAHLHILLGEARASVVKDNIARRPSAGLEPG